LCGYKRKNKDVSPCYPKILQHAIETDCTIL
jgi:hypothetical protein